MLFGLSQQLPSTGTPPVLAVCSKRTYQLYVASQLNCDSCHMRVNLYLAVSEDWRVYYPLVPTLPQLRNVGHGSHLVRLLTLFMLADIDCLEEEWQPSSLSGSSEDGIRL